MVLVFAIIAIVFGAMTLFSGGSVLLVDGQARIDAGNYVPFVLWFNFLAGFAYILAGIGLVLWQHWAAKLSMWIAIATLLAFAAFGFHIVSGGEFEQRTLGAMTLRSAMWLIIAWFSLKTWNTNSARQ